MVGSLSTELSMVCSLSTELSRVGSLSDIYFLAGSISVINANFEIGFSVQYENNQLESTVLYKGKMGFLTILLMQLAATIPYRGCVLTL